MYDYSCQAGNYYRSYYRSTLEFYYDMTTTTKKEEVVDVEKEQTTTGASTSLPPLRAPRPDHLVDWHDVRNDLIDDLIKAHKNYDYKVPSNTREAYYNTFSGLLLPASTDGEGDDSESEEELQSMIQTHRMWAPLLATTEGPDALKTYYIMLEGEELQSWQTTGRNDVKLSDWKATQSTLTRVYQHLHLFEQPLQTLNYATSLVATAMSTTTVPINESLYLVALNTYPEAVLQRNLLHTYRRSGSNYLST